MNAIVDVNNIVLETERLILRSWKQSDLNDLFEYASVDGVGQMAGWKPHDSLAESQKILDMFIDERKTFALELKENHKVIGSLGLECCNTALDSSFDQLIGREVGYVLSKEYWGQGLAPEAVRRVIAYCFDEMKYDFLCCAYFHTNPQSGRVNEKCGFTFYKEIEFETRFGTKEKSNLNVLKR